MKNRTRFAPTPNGYLHLGNAFNLILTSLIAKIESADICLRIDDFDRLRVEKIYLDDIFYVLDWLGLEWQVGPGSVEEFENKFSQTLRMQKYKQVFQQMFEQNQVFACECSRKDIEHRNPLGHYDGRCLKKTFPSGQKDLCWRFPLQSKTSKIDEWGLGVNELTVEDSYPVLWRRDSLPAYHLVSIIEDQDLGVNLLVRGQDLLESTAIQVELAKTLKYQTLVASKFCHHPLLLQGPEKLSKSRHEKGQSIRHDWSRPEKIYSMLGQILGAAPNTKFENIENLWDYCQNQNSFKKEHWRKDKILDPYLTWKSLH